MAQYSFTFSLNIFCKGSFTNYVYKTRLVGGPKMSTQGGRWSKKIQNLVNVVCERPPRVKSRHIHFSFDVFYSSMDDLPLNIIRKKHILQIMRYKKSHTKEYLCRYMTWHSFTFSLCIFLPILKKHMCYLLRHMYLFFCCFLLKHG